jgi:hypothetical protein
MASSQDSMRLTRFIIASFVVMIGWLFIIWQNRFHGGAPVVFLCLAYLAVVTIVMNLWRTGASVATEEDDDDWARPMGEHDELEKEKFTLLKAIKEAEFDRDMGKLSAEDADAMIRNYRARAIAVIKALEGHEQQAASVREKIEKEVQARLQLEPKQKAKKAKKDDKDKKEAAP